MAITSAEIHNQSFSIDRNGYDVDEVDVFLEHVADEIDGLNQQIASLQSQIGEDSFAGFDRPATFDDEAFDEPEPEHAAEQDDQPADSIDPTILAEKDAAIAERDARIAELEKQLESKKADGNAIAQALIIAQRSADEILATPRPMPPPRSRMLRTRPTVSSTRPRTIARRSSMPFTSSRMIARRRARIIATCSTTSSPTPLASLPKSARRPRRPQARSLPASMAATPRMSSPSPW